MTSDDRLDILSELSLREPIFHRREFGTSPADLDRMIAPDFFEIGASGALYEREFIIATLLERYKEPEAHDWPCRDFRLRELAPGLFQLSYILTQPSRTTRRTTLWRRTEAGWVIAFHQGTVIA